MKDILALEDDHMPVKPTRRCTIVEKRPLLVSDNAASND
jgi:hypothetical protein